MFFSTFEKSLDAKRRIVVPQEFRAAVSGPFDGVFCFPSVEADCIEGGGKALFDRHESLINELEIGDPLRFAPYRILRLSPVPQVVTRVETPRWSVSAYARKPPSRSRGSGQRRP